MCLLTGSKAVFCVVLAQKTAPTAAIIEGGKLVPRHSVFNCGAAENLIQEVPTMRVKITLACTECKRRNYVSKKNKKNDPDRIEMKKHCRFCNKHTIHKETK